MVDECERPSGDSAPARWTAFARTLAAELGDQGTRENALSRGIVMAQFFANSNVGEGACGQFEELAGKA